MRRYDLEGTKLRRPFYDVRACFSFPALDRRAICSPRVPPSRGVSLLVRMNKALDGAPSRALSAGLMVSRAKHRRCT